MAYSDNPVRDAARYDFLQHQWRESRPICAGCEEPILDDVCYQVGSKKYCMECEDLAWSKIKGEYLSYV